jgi:hypothetical protein
MEQLTKTLPQKAEYWEGDVLEDGPGNRWKVVDFAYSPLSGEFVYKIEKVERKPPYDHEGWNTITRDVL